MLDDPIAFLNARIDEDEAAAKAGLHDPARALREVEAKRRLLELAWDADQTDRILDEEIARKVSPGELTTGGLMIRAMAAVYSDHPDYRSGWAYDIKETAS